MADLGVYGFLTKVRLELVGEKQPPFRPEQAHLKKEILAACLGGTGIKQQGHQASWGHTGMGVNTTHCVSCSESVSSDIRSCRQAGGGAALWQQQQGGAGAGWQQGGGW